MTPTLTLEQFQRYIIHSYIYSLTFYYCCLFTWNLQRYEKISLVLHMRWCHISLNKKFENAYIFCILLLQKNSVRHFLIGKSSLLFTDKILRRREIYYDVTIDVMHVECSAYIWRIFAFFVLNGLHLLPQVTKN